MSPGLFYLEKTRQAYCADDISAYRRPFSLNFFGKWAIVFFGSVVSDRLSGLLGGR